MQFIIVKKKSCDIVAKNHTHESSHARNVLATASEKCQMARTTIWLTRTQVQHRRFLLS